MGTHAHTALIHPYVSNAEKTTFHRRAQNRQTLQQNAASVKGHIQPTTRDAQYIKQSPGSTTTTSQARKPSSYRPLISTPTQILIIISNSQTPKAHPGHVRMLM